MMKADVLFNIYPKGGQAGDVFNVDAVSPTPTTFPGGGVPIVMEDFDDKE